MNCVTRRLFPALLGRDAAVTPAHVRAAFLQAQHWLSTDASSISVSEESSGSEDPSPLNRPDPFLSHLQHKTENDLLDLLAHKDKDEAFDDAEDDKMVSFIALVTRRNVLGLAEALARLEGAQV